MEAFFTIICRGSIDEGMGHLFRTKTFSKKLIEKNLDFQVIAITDQFVRSALYELKDIVTFVSTDEEVIAHLHFPKNKQIITVFDLIHFEPNLFHTIKENSRLLVSISPVFNLMDGVDILFSRLEHQQEKQQNYVIYSGLEYILLNDTVTIISEKQYLENIQEEMFPIGITMGGGDSANKTKKVIQSIKYVEKPLTLWVLLGEGYSHSYTELADIIKQDKRHEIILARTNKSMWKLLSNCAVVITSGGITFTEAVYAGLPAINLYDSDEHAKRVPAVFNQNQIGLHLGVINKKNLSQLRKQISELLSKQEHLFSMRKRMLNLIDSNGGDRIIDLIFKHL